MVFTTNLRNIPINPKRCKPGIAHSFNSKYLQPVEVTGVSLFNFWYQPTTAQLAIESTYTAEGKDVLLRVRNKPSSVLRLFWYKGEGLEAIHSLSTKTPMHFLVMRRPPGFFQRLKLTEMSQVPTLVEEAFGEKEELVASLVASNTAVTENKDSVVLTCNTNAHSIHWLFKGMNLKLNERMKVSEDHRSLTINPVKREDAGYYWCEVSNPLGSTQSWPVTLDVKFE
ncbi:cell adhesion molecule CEACAM21-like [Glossophaga mutica]